MGSSVKRAIKSTFKKVLIVVAIVAVATLALAAFAPATLGALGITVGAGAVGAATAVGEAVMTVALSVEALIGFGISTYMSYTVDKEAADSKEDIERELKQAEEEGKKHFLEMEQDRYDEYDGPAIGMTWDRETEKELMETDTDDTVQDTNSTFLILGTLASFLLYKGVVSLG